MAILLACALLPVSAQTNAPAPQLTDEELFFVKYREAVALQQARKTQQAGLELELLSRQLSSSPWLEVALLKGAELAEASNEKAALEMHELLRQRLEKAPYFQGDADRAQLLRAALGGAVKAGINRVRAARVRAALERYRLRYQEYPESLAKLAVLDYTTGENILDADLQPLRYIPGGMKLTPFISYKRYSGLEYSPPEPLLVAVPRVDNTTRVSDEPLRYAALIHVANKEPARVVENQLLHGFLVVAVAERGVIVCNHNRVLVLLTRK
jgi:hypothetical protein